MARVELIVGPAGAGKTARVLAAFRDELAARGREGRFGTAVWITPTQRSRREVLASLLGGEHGVVFAPHVLTFDEFAERLLRSSPTAVRPLSKIAKRKLLRDLIDDLSRKRKLRHFAAVAHTAGFLELCVSFISELKREEVWPEDFAEVCEKAGDGDDEPEEPAPAKPRRRASQRDRELALIYNAYQGTLHAAPGKKLRRDATDGLYDGEGRFWWARNCMVRGDRGPFGELTLAVADGFTDFTRTQYEMLAELAGWADRLLVTLPQDGDSRRDDLFSKSSLAVETLRKAAEPRHDVSVVRLREPAADRPEAFRHLSKHLFDNPRELPRSGDGRGLRVLACVRRSGELEAIAREVKRRLVDGTPPDEVVVAFRTLDGLADQVREVFAAAGIPVACEQGPPIASCGAVRLLKSVLMLEREDWPFPRLTGLLGSPLFRTDWPGVADGAAPRAVAAALRDLNLDGGQASILAAVHRRADLPDGRSRIDWTLAAETLERLDAELAVFRKPARFPDWVDRLLHVASSLGLCPVADETIPGDDGRLAESEWAKWQAFVRLIEEARKAETLAGAPDRTLPLLDFCRQLDELLAAQTCDPENDDGGRVRVLAAEQVRNLDVSHLFVGGLSEAGFPARGGEDCLFGDAERSRLNEHGLPLGHRARRGREEMLLFYGLVTRARRTLTLSHPIVDDDGEPLYRSPYLQAVLDAFESDAVPIESCGQLDPVPADPATCVTDAELRAAATRDALAGRPELFAGMAGRRRFGEAAVHVAAAAEMAAARFATRGLTNYEGLLSDPRNVKRLRQRFSGAHEFSATELETYAAHPFRFFLAVVLGLEPLAEPGPATDFSRRGQVMHAALASLHRRLVEDSADAATAETLDELLAAEVEAAAARHVGDSPLQRALHRIERQILARRAERYGPQWAAYLKTFGGLWDGSPRPTHFEVPFGNAPAEEGDEDRPRFPVVEFGPDGDRVRVRGRIDRIDVGTADGRPVFNVIDYKLGNPPRFTPEDVDRGRALQLVLYAAAAARLGVVEAELFQLGFWGLSDDGFVCGQKSRSRSIAGVDAETAAAFEEGLNRVLPRLAAAIRAGRFPVVTDDPDERYNGDYAAVARVGSFRAVAEPLDKRLPDDAPGSPKDLNAARSEVAAAEVASP